MPRFPKGSQEAKDYMASVRAKRGSGVSGSKEEGSEKKPLIPRPSKLKDTEEVREQLNKNRYVIANEVEKALKKGEITQEDRLYLLTLLGEPYRSGKDDVNEMADNQTEVFMGLMELTAKKGSGMGSCASGGSAVSSNTSGPSGPPPPRPPRPPLPPPIDTSFSINQSLIDAIEEALMSSDILPERREQLITELRKLKQRVNDAGVAKESTAKPSGAGMKGKGSKSAKIAPAIPTAPVEVIERPITASVLQGGEDDGVPEVPIDLNFEEVTEREEPQMAIPEEMLDELYLFYKPILDNDIRKIEEQIKKKQKEIDTIYSDLAFNRSLTFGDIDTGFIQMKKDRKSRLRADIENLEKELSFVESKILLLNPQNRELFELTPSEYRNFREAYFPVSEIKKSLVRKPTFVEKAKSMIYKPTIAEIVGNEGDNVTMNVNEVKEPYSFADFGERERERERARVAEEAILEERRREKAEMRTMGGYDKDVGGSGMKGKSKTKNESYLVQSVIFKKDMFSVSKAKKWLKENNHKVVKVDKTKDMLRFRQIDPAEVEKMGFTEYRTKPLGDSGVELILAYKQKN